MPDLEPEAEVITDKVNNMTVQDVSDQKSDWGATVESVLSGDTLTVIKPAPLPQRGRKRQRVEPEAGTSTQSDLRERYPIETKKPYLACKNLHKKKLALAFTIARVEEDLNNGRSPQETNITHRIPGRIAHHQGLRNQWDQVLIESSNRLAHLYMDKLKDDYIDTKRKINEKLDEMKESLEPAQFNEIKDSLSLNYKKAASKQPVDFRRGVPRQPARQQPGARQGQPRAPYRPPPAQNRGLRQQPSRRFVPMRAPRRSTQPPINTGDLVGQIMALISNKYQ
jgi:hypothetical protein